MRRSVLLLVPAILGIAIGSSGGASAGMRTYVTFAGRDDAVPKLGRPGIAVHVEAPGGVHAASVAAELSRGLSRLVHTRPLRDGEAGDYDLLVTLEEPRATGGTETIRFAALLASERGEKLWRIEGHSDVEDAPLDAKVYAGISRNVVSALIHDGWVQPRYDPDNPPPQPPVVRNEDSRR